MATGGCTPGTWRSSGRSKPPRQSRDSARWCTGGRLRVLSLVSSASSSVLPLPSPESRDSRSPHWLFFLRLGARPRLFQLERRLPQLAQGELRRLDWERGGDQVRVWQGILGSVVPTSEAGEDLRPTSSSQLKEAAGFPGWRFLLHLLPSTHLPPTESSFPFPTLPCPAISWKNTKDFWSKLSGSTETLLPLLESPKG